MIAPRADVCAALEARQTLRVRGCMGLAGGALLAQGHAFASSTSSVVRWFAAVNSLEAVLELGDAWSLDLDVSLVLPLVEASIALKGTASPQTVVAERTLAAVGGFVGLGPVYRFRRGAPLPPSRKPVTLSRKRVGPSRKPFSPETMPVGPRGTPLDPETGRLGERAIRLVASRKRIAGAPRRVLACGIAFRRPMRRLTDATKRLGRRPKPPARSPTRIIEGVTSLLRVPRRFLRGAEGLGPRPKPSVGSPTRIVEGVTSLLRSPTRLLHGTEGLGPRPKAPAHSPTRVVEGETSPPRSPARFLDGPRGAKDGRAPAPIAMPPRPAGGVPGPRSSDERERTTVGRAPHAAMSYGPRPRARTPRRSQPAFASGRQGPMSSTVPFSRSVANCAGLMPPASGS